MITKLTLNHFQAHADSELVLGPGVNVITGQSNVGKSSIIRALIWLLCNRPSGESFRSHWTERKHRMDVVATFLDEDGTEHEVIRFRKGQSNGYTLNGEDLVAIRQGVPKEVSKILRMEEHNIQSQFTPYFLLADSPGEVARELNRVCGLDIIDACLSNASALIRNSNTEASFHKGKVEEYTAELEQYQDLEERDKKLKELETLAEQVKELRPKGVRLKELSEGVASLTQQVHDKAEWLSVEGKAQPLMKVLDSLNTLTPSIATLEHRISRAKSMQEQIRDVEAILALEGKVAEMNELRTEERNTSRRIENLELHLGSLEDLQARATEAEEEVQSYTEEYNDLLQELGVCPTCGQKIHGGTHAGKAANDGEPPATKRPRKPVQNKGTLPKV